VLASGPYSAKFCPRGSNLWSHYCCKDKCGRLIDFLNQISKLSYFNMIDLADFLMHI